MFKSIGKLVYSPQTHLSSSKNWVVLMCDDEISSYYRKLYEKQYPFKNGEYTNKLNRPVWGAHISVVRAEKIKDMSIWGNNNSKIIDFEYEPGVFDNKEYFWMKVYSKQLVDFRRSLGLNDYPKFGFHLTIGRVT